MAASKKTGKTSPRAGEPAEDRLDKMIETAIVDAYGESEQIVGFYKMLDGNLALPFKTEILGVEVMVEKIDLTNDEQIVAVCSRGKAKQRVPLLDLPLPSPSPKPPTDKRVDTRKVRRHERIPVLRISSHRPSALSQGGGRSAVVLDPGSHHPDKLRQ
jgi:hypothetical protein